MYTLLLIIIYIYNESNRKFFMSHSRLRYFSSDYACRRLYKEMKTPEFINITFSPHLLSREVNTLDHEVLHTSLLVSRIISSRLSFSINTFSEITEIQFVGVEETFERRNDIEGKRDIADTLYRRR